MAKFAQRAPPAGRAAFIAIAMTFAVTHLARGGHQGHGKSVGGSVLIASAKPSDAAEPLRVAPTESGSDSSSSPFDVVFESPDIKMGNDARPPWLEFCPIQGMTLICGLDRILAVQDGSVVARPDLERGLPMAGATLTKRVVTFGGVWPAGAFLRLGTYPKEDEEERRYRWSGHKWRFVDWPRHGAWHDPDPMYAPEGWIVAAGPGVVFGFVYKPGMAGVFELLAGPPGTVVPKLPAGRRDCEAGPINPTGLAAFSSGEIFMAGNACVPSNGGGPQRDYDDPRAHSKPQPAEILKWMPRQRKGVLLPVPTRRGAELSLSSIDVLGNRLVVSGIYAFLANTGRPTMWWPSEKVVAELGVWLLEGETWSAVETPRGFSIDKSEEFSLEPDGTSWWRSDKVRRRRPGEADWREVPLPPGVIPGRLRVISPSGVWLTGIRDQHLVLLRSREQ
jgi:hypothetical protein